jgi:hypothetical protein
VAVREEALQLRRQEHLWAVVLSEAALSEAALSVEVRSFMSKANYNREEFQRLKSPNHFIR